MASGNAPLSSHDAGTEVRLSSTTNTNATPDTNGPRVALLEPWFEDSHAALFKGISRHCGFPCDLLTLKPLMWRWRMRMGAVHQARQLDSLPHGPTVIIASDYVDLNVLQGLSRKYSLDTVPMIMYFLENQLTYPLKEGEQRDFEFGGINILSAMRADQLVFCSQVQLDEFLGAIPGYLKHERELDSKAIVSELYSKSRVIPIGVTLPALDSVRIARTPVADLAGEPIRFVWPHRFEPDKNPDTFFNLLLELQEEGLDFRVYALGRKYRHLPASMQRARDQLSPERIGHWGYLGREEYLQTLGACDVVVSTAFQETQGVAVIEGIRAGCRPLLPRRLSYPEVLGPALADDKDAKVLYKTEGDLRRVMRWMCKYPDKVRAGRDRYYQAMDRFGWDVVGKQFEELLTSLVHNGRSPLPPK